MATPIVCNFDLSYELPSYKSIIFSRKSVSQSDPRDRVSGMEPNLNCSAPRQSRNKVLQGFSVDANDADLSSTLKSVRE